jgi:hypothetical protein
VLVDAALVVNAERGKAAVTVSQHAATPLDTRTRDLGCIGFHGTGNGRSMNGKCIN